MKRHLRTVLGITVAALACLSIATVTYHFAHQNSASPAAQNPNAEYAASYSPTAGKPGTKTFKITISDNRITGSDAITVNEGDAIHLVFTGGDSQTEGDILIEGYNLTVPTTRNYSTSMEFIALKVGSFPIKLTYEDASYEAAEQRDEVAGSAEVSQMHTTTLGTFVVK